MTIDFPYRIDGRGRTGTTGDPDHVRDMIEQVLFTTPGERVMHPSFGSGLLGLAFEPASTELAATVQFLVQGALVQELQNVIVVEGVDVGVGPDGNHLQITVGWTELLDGTPGSATFGLPGGAA